MTARRRSARRRDGSAARGRPGVRPRPYPPRRGGPGRAVLRRLEATVSEHPDHIPAGLLALTPRERAKLAAILARLASPHDGERAAAGLLASAFVAKHGLAWADLIALLRPAPERPAAPEATPDRAPGQERRRKGAKTWRGFCRRRSVTPGRALDRLT